ncbi:MAG: bacillithiol biosynthesis deacetylase BshB1 [Bacteroidetes bacterium]|nr:MAG: bacillithiol biosynthesis deacetylase BshB1 [Bacteroidota bacterium]
MKLDILAFGAHPDDVELSCSGTLAKQSSLGYKCGVVDLTQGELGTRGTAEIRLEEAQAAGKIMGLAIRENLGFKDGFFKNDIEHQFEVIRMIRKYRPEIIIANAPTDRHPDHGRGSFLVKEASFLAGLRKIETLDDGLVQEPYRPSLLLYYIQFQSLTPDFIMDIGEHIHTKVASIKAYKSQFYDPNSNEPQTVISSKNFMESVHYRAQDMGRLIGVEYGEGFIKAQDLGLSDLMHLSGVR